MLYAVQVRLLNGSAVCNMRMGRWEEAESQLMEAFEKDAKNPDTLANLATASMHLGKPASRFIGCENFAQYCYAAWRRLPTMALKHPSMSVCRQLKTVAPQHAAVLRTMAAEEAFDRAAASFGSSAA
jgi:coatomer protein complex subunit epsilon